MTARSPGWRRALVTGATGFLGRALVSTLTSHGVEVTGTSRSPHDEHADVRWFTGDLADESCAADAVRHADPDVIFHLSGAVTGSRDVGVTLRTYHSLLTSTVNLLVAATREGSPTFVLAGSMEDSMGADVPASPYAAAKEAARRYAAMFHRLHGLPTVTARIFMVYGPGRQDEQRFIPYVIRSLQRGSDLRLSSGRRPVDWVYVDDVVDGLVALGSHEAVGGRTVDIGTGETHTVREVGERLRNIMGASSELPWGSAEDRRFEQVAVADVQPALEVCGWRARTALPDGLTRTVDWFRTDSGPDE